MLSQVHEANHLWRMETTPSRQLQALQCSPDAHYETFFKSFFMMQCYAALLCTDYRG